MSQLKIEKNECAAEVETRNRHTEGDKVSTEEGGRGKDTQKECLGAAEAEKAIDTQKEKLSRLTRKELQREVCPTQRAGGSRLGELQVYG